MLPVEQPFKTYTGLDGKPLDDGFVYFGLPNQDSIAHPVTVYWDAAGTLPAAQPLRTVSGYIMKNGAPANVFFTGSFSELVLDSKERQVFYAKTSDEFSLSTLVTGALTDLQATMRGTVNVFKFGAKGDGSTNDSAAFQAAIDALPTQGGRIIVPDAAYVLNTAPAWGAKSIYWDIGPGATFSGTATGQNKFPSMRTNGGQIAVGPFIQSQSRIPYSYSSPFVGGVAAFQVEMIQPADVVGQSVGLYAGGEGSNPNVNANVWAMNALVKAAPGAGGTYQGLEMDVDVYSSAALVKGISLNGIGTANPDVGLELIRSDATRWVTGIDIMNAIVGVQVRNTEGLTMGITVGQPSAQGSTPIAVKQLSNGGDGVMVQRLTDSTPTGSAFRVVDAANTKNLVNIDVLGNATVQSLLLAGGAVSAGPGQFSLGNTITATASAGTAAALPAKPANYWTVLLGSTVVKIPYYND